MLYEQLKQQIPVFLKESNKNLGILRLVISDCDRIIANSGAITDAEVLRVIKKIFVSNEETMKARPSEELVTENLFLSSYIPKEIPLNKVYEILQEHSAKIKSYPNDGIAIKTTISEFPSLPTKNVSLAVKQIRTQ